MRRHDGLQHVLAQLVAADAALPSSHGTPYRLTVLVPHTTLTATLRPANRSASGSGSGSADTALAPALLPDGWPLSPLTAQTLACDADLVPVLVDDHHHPLDVADTIYSFPAKTRTAIITRDRHCTYPGCTAPPPWCDVHHLTPYSQGGPTTVANGALLCGRHHRHVHALNLRGHLHHDAITWQPPPRHHDPHHHLPTTPTTSATAIDHALTALTRRWLHRNPHLRG